MATGRNRFGHRNAGYGWLRVVKRIRETDPDTPILFSSGRVSPKDVVKGYELGVNNYLKKPFLPEELNAHVQALMKMKQKAPAATPAPKTPVMAEGIYQIGKNYTLDAEHATLKHASGTNKTLTAREKNYCKCFAKERRSSETRNHP